MDPATIMTILIAGATAAGTEFAKAAGKGAWEGIKSLFPEEKEKKALTTLETNPEDEDALTTLQQTVSNFSDEQNKAVHTAATPLLASLNEPKLAEAINVKLGNIRAKGNVNLQNIASDIGSVRLEVGEIRTDGEFNLTGIGASQPKKR